MSPTAALQRRELLQLIGVSSLGVAGASVVAGCTPAEPKSSSSAAGKAAGSGGEFHAGTLYLVSPQGNYNCAGQPFVKVPNAILFSGNYGDLVMLPSAFYHWKEQTWDPFLMESHQLQGKTHTVTIRSGLTWSDGTRLTSKDYLTTFWCQWAMNSPLWSYVEDLDAPDEQTFTLTMKEPAPVVERYLLHSNILPTAQYGKFADRAEALFRKGDSTSSSQGAKLNKDLVSFAPDRYLASGPFDLDYKTITNTQLSLVKNPRGYAADRVNFDKILIYNGETPAITPLVLSKDIDYATNGFPVASAKQFEKIGYRILRPPTYSGPALYMNFGKLEELAEPSVRQALNQAIDHRQNGQAALGDSGQPPKYFTGFSDNLVDVWMAADSKQQLSSYDHDQDAAARTLEKAGWKRSGSSWQLPNGKPAAYELLYPSDYSDWSGAAKDLAEQLTRFGIKITLHGVVSTQQPVDVTKGNFQLAIQSWGNSSQPYPYFSFVQAFMTYNYPIAKNNGGRGMDYALQRTVPGFGRVDIATLIDRSGSGADDNAIRANIAKLGRLFNAELPIIPLFERLGNSPALDGVRVERFPADDDPLVQNSLYADNVVILSMLSGELKAAAK
ncbi:ABC transporter substrate-binding protein [Microlunatus soli]|uniref:Peptide/nickel transport system substrate-binding protein n=1 Tax=Microlunatus soli TaxID=630515 RepID=A0A1H1RWS9_9ACTN|nr:ABC transporter substrate-binding protein [Microlunatus soli]SDS40184.1 peptide/nickel transport system substrate-binding protein [Microlunatus soli]